ncbi:MAG TPA: cysteine--tRNA ligase [Ktedonobacterales bacterium]|jgi:L-cysteine:1D-myo-inositol 2-amino-2-deoxy-alpha-D-glucopyranoside ligase
MELFNTLTQRIEPLHPHGDEVTLYVCGVTPYDTTHLGHAAINVYYDTLIRFLRSEGQAVNYVQNVTDIDDDIIRKAREEGTSWDELGRRETMRYLADLRALNVLPPTHYVWATNEIPRMVCVIEKLIERGNAYVRDGWVYFSVASDPTFGALAEADGYHGYANWLATANERGNTPDDPRKNDPLDFVLWQAHQEGEPSWESPWGAGRPGWHIECSAMAMGHLGNRIDIHGGGADLIFPHHTCEIAQSENSSGERPFVQIWMHCGMVYLGEEKMSKSLGNLVLVRNLLETYTSAAVRVLLLSHHYREPWEYTDDDMRQSAARAARYTDAVTKMEGAAHAENGDNSAVDLARQRFAEALSHDLNTPATLHILDELANGATIAELRAIKDLGGILGLRLNASEDEGSAQAS